MESQSNDIIVPQTEPIPISTMQSLKSYIIVPYLHMLHHRTNTKNVKTNRHAFTVQRICVKVTLHLLVILENINKYSFE